MAEWEPPDYRFFYADECLCGWVIRRNDAVPLETYRLACPECGTEIGKWEKRGEDGKSNTETDQG